MSAAEVCCDLFELRGDLQCLWPFLSCYLLFQLLFTGSLLRLIFFYSQVSSPQENLHNFIVHSHSPWLTSSTSTVEFYWNCNPRHIWEQAPHKKDKGGQSRGREGVFWIWEGREGKFRHGKDLGQLRSPPSYPNPLTRPESPTWGSACRTCASNFSSAVAPLGRLGLDSV